MDSEVMEVTAKGCTPEGAELVKTVNLRYGLLWPGRVCHNCFPGIALEEGSKLSQKLTEAGFVKEGYLSLTAKVSLSMGSAKRKALVE